MTGVHRKREEKRRAERKTDDKEEETEGRRRRLIRMVAVGSSAWHCGSPFSRPPDPCIVIGTANVKCLTVCNGRGTPGAAGPDARRRQCRRALGHELGMSGRGIRSGPGPLGTGPAERGGGEVAGGNRQVTVTVTVCRIVGSRLRLRHSLQLTELRTANVYM